MSWRYTNSRMSEISRTELFTTSWLIEKTAKTMHKNKIRIDINIMYISILFILGIGNKVINIISRFAQELGVLFICISIFMNNLEW